VPTRGIVPRKEPAHGQHDNVGVLPLDLASGIGHRTRGKQADLNRIAFE
jgi:hypothetical protein